MPADLARIRQVFLDMDGTIYRGGTLFPTTLPFLDFLRRRGVQYTFLTNNSSYGADEYVAKLAALGINIAPGNLYTSTDYAADYLRRHHPEWRRLHFFGMPAAGRDLAARGFALTEEPPQAVLVAFHRDFHYRDLCRAAHWLRQGVPGLATHPDVFCPTDQPTWLPDCGAVTRCLEEATGTKLTVLGKPDPGMLLAAAARRGERDPAALLMVGDRLATDIALGRNAGALTCHIAGAEADLAPPDNIIPDIAVKNLGELQALWMG